MYTEHTHTHDITYACVYKLSVDICACASVSTSGHLVVFVFNWKPHSFAYACTLTAPEVTSNVALVADQVNAVVTLDWSNSFRFNGILRYFIIARNNITLIQSPIIRFVFNNEPVSYLIALIIISLNKS